MVTATTLARRYKLLKGCESCGYRKHYASLHYNHLDPSTKKKNVSSCRTITAVKAEIRKCEVLCANCHAIKSTEEKHHLNPSTGRTRADKEKRKLITRLALSRQRVKKQKGRCEGRKPYDNQPVIQQIINYRNNHNSYQKIADILNNESIPSPYNSVWSPNAVRRVWLRTTDKQPPPLQSYGENN